MSDDAILIDDGHGWETVYRHPGLKREVAECRSHGKGPGCGIRKYAEDGSWVIADVAPWVDPEHVEAHVRSGS